MTTDSSLPAVVCIVGKKKSGKTTLAVKLVAELAARGRRVMTVKHGHGFDLDTPGSDSWRHRHEGGARRVVLAGPQDLAVVGGWGPAGEMGLEEIVRRFLWDAEIVVAEGYKRERLPKIEIYRRAAHPEPVYDPARAHEIGRYLAIVTDAPGFQAPCPIFDADDPTLSARLADLVERDLLSAP
ncbi:MAG: molybdopterin-guanine dinucleotide biosynthesis protein B [Gemmatimonadetes bacterium]|nr:molybdopterin-guanine dinucleotide biosynthesis protein B [Gemmatimonadota bacterium]